MLNFFIGVIVGGAVGVIAMCFVAMARVSDTGLHSEKQQDTKPMDSDM